MIQRAPTILPEQIQTLKSSPARREEMRRRGYSRALKFSWDDSAARILDLICEELGTRKASEASEGGCLRSGQYRDCALVSDAFTNAGLGTAPKTASSCRSGGTLSLASPS